MPTTVIITRDLEWNEYQVLPAGAPARQTYHTDDRQDAVDTAKAIAGADCRIVFKTKR